MSDTGKQDKDAGDALDVRGGIRYAAELQCPDCGEPLWVAVYIDAAGVRVEVMRRRDIPSEDEGEGVEGVAGDPAGASGSEGDGREGDPGE